MTTLCVPRGQKEKTEENENSLIVPNSYFDEKMKDKITDKVVSRALGL